MSWYGKVTNNLSNLPAFIEYCEKEMLNAKKESSINGNVERNLRDLPGITEHRFNQLQEIEAVLNYLNIQLRKIRRKWFVKYLENYNRALSSRDAEKYVDGEDEVVDYEAIINEVALIRNKYLGILKGLETKGFQLNNITRLRVAGMEEISI